MQQYMGGLRRENFPSTPPKPVLIPEGSYAVPEKRERGTPKKVPCAKLLNNPFQYSSRQWPDPKHDMNVTMLGRVQARMGRTMSEHKKTYDCG